MFPEDLLCLPPDQELEFGIELLSRLAPISIPLYRMTPTKLKELKTQLQDLVDKGFIRPTVFTLGSSSIVCEEKGWNQLVMY